MRLDFSHLNVVAVLINTLGNYKPKNNNCRVKVLEVMEVISVVGEITSAIVEVLRATAKND